MAYFHGSPIVSRRLHVKILSDIGFPVESGDNVDSFGFVDPQGRSSVSDVPALAAYCELQDLRQGVAVAGCHELKGDSPLFGEGWEGGQKGVLLQQMHLWKGE